ncbi:hypothetical protein KEM48_002236 [Puccinia striiformis f. sp. tritici PST-130]|nr:hypothetical protein KEM48_002236 [Puccinia striiformis f. sp. tritici PST-130]
MQGITDEEAANNNEETEVLDDHADMLVTFSCLPAMIMTISRLEHVTPVRPAPPPDNTWTSARGAVLPEAEAFCRSSLLVRVPLQGSSLLSSPASPTEQTTLPPG